jgi:hypothetical protein
MKAQTEHLYVDKFSLRTVVKFANMKVGYVTWGN